MEIKGHLVDVTRVGWQQIGSNHFSVAGFIDGLFEMSDIDNTLMWFNEIKARQVLCSSLRKQFRIGEKVCVFFTAEAIT